MKVRRKFVTLLAVLIPFALIAAACGNADDTSPGDTAAPAVPGAAEATADTEHMGDGSLGEILVPAGEAVQIRSLNAITGDVAFLGIPNQRAVEFAVTDYGDIKGFAVDSGEGLDDLCSADGGQAAAQIIVADEQVAGIIGTTCSGAATAAAPLISEAGIVMIAPSNTSPALTSDLQGNAGENYNKGYYRTAHNDLFQGAAMADFVFNELGLTSAAAIHDGDPYTEGLSRAFADAYEALGGTVTTVTAVGKEDTDMVPVLTEVAAGSPEALFFPIFLPAGNFVADQARGVTGLENTVLLAADGLLADDFLEQEQSEGLYFSGPDVRYGANFNQSTGVSADEFLERYEAEFGEPPTASFWANAYDATALLLDAIDAASFVDEDGVLHIDKAGVRTYLDALRGYKGMIGTLNCDEFGDCGAPKITVILHESADDIQASKDNVVFEFVPSS